jgi:hypothetical protein
MAPATAAEEPAPIGVADAGALARPSVPAASAAASAAVLRNLIAFSVIKNVAHERRASEARHDHATLPPPT